MTTVVRCGDYREIHADRKPLVSGHTWLWDTIVTDPPFGKRTHDGARTCAEHDQHGVVAYSHWTATQVKEFVAWAVPRTRRWVAAMTSHDLIPAWEAAYKASGFYHFAPVPIIIRGMGVRRQGDGSASWALYLMTARARNRDAMTNPASNGTALWRALPGGYVWTPSPIRRGQGYDKPVAGLREIVGDYSNPGDVVCDPLAGYGSTLVAAVQGGRKVIGSEMVTEVAREANEAIANASKWAARKTAKSVNTAA